MAKVIAEFCQNHRGDLNTLKSMVWAAADAGADYAKIQSMLADDLTYRERFERGDGTIRRPYRNEYERLKRMDLSNGAHLRFIEECEVAGIKPLTSVFSQSRIPFLASLPWKEIKVPSYDCASFPMIRELKLHFNHLFISTGATHDYEVEKTAEILAGHSFTFLHCVTVYPTPLDAMNLARMEYLRKFTPHVGFSDHSLAEQDGLKASIAALYLGADIVERHFTIVERKLTRDGPISVNPAQLKELVGYARMKKSELEEHVREIPEFNQMIGVERSNLGCEELRNRDYYRGRFASRIGDRVVFNWEELP